MNRKDLLVVLAIVFAIVGVIYLAMAKIKEERIFKDACTEQGGIVVYSDKGPKGGYTGPICVDADIVLTRGN